MSLSKNYPILTLIILPFEFLSVCVFPIFESTIHISLTLYLNHVLFLAIATNTKDINALVKMVMFTFLDMLSLMSVHSLFPILVLTIMPLQSHLLSSYQYFMSFFPLHICPIYLPQSLYLPPTLPRFLLHYKLPSQTHYLLHLFLPPIGSLFPLLRTFRQWLLGPKQAYCKPKVYVSQLTHIHEPNTINDALAHPSWCNAMK